MPPYGSSPLYLASSNEHFEVVQLLLSASDANVDAYFPLYTASQHGHAEVVKLLLGAGAPVNKTNVPQGDSSLHVASYLGHVEVVKLLLGAGANVNQANYTGASPIYVASQRTQRTCGQVEVVKLLLEAGANIEQVNNNNCSPLYAACDFGRTEVVKVLLASGVGVNKVGKMHQSHLAAACSGMNATVELVRLLLDAGASVDFASTSGCGTYSCWCRTPAMVRVLLGAGVSVVNTGPNSSQTTHLHHASSTGNLEVVKLLLDARATVGTVDERGKTALDRARQFQRNQVYRRECTTESTAKSQELVRLLEAADVVTKLAKGAHTHSLLFLVSCLPC